jgi:hypothetical protein
MARIIELVASSDGEKFLLFGFNASELATFSIQLYITKYGQRAIDFMQSLSLGMASFMGGDIWVHNSNDVPRCNLYGEQKYSEVGVVANQEPNLVKLLDSIGIYTDGKWSVESVTIPKTLNYPNGQYSMIPKERFKRREGVWQSEFLRNGKTSSGTINVIEYIKGESLRGGSAYLVLRNTDTSQVKLYKVDLLMSGSR